MVGFVPNFRLFNLCDRSVFFYFDCLSLLLSYKAKMLPFKNILRDALPISGYVNPQSQKLLTSLVEG